MTKELLKMNCYNCGTKHCQSVLCLEESYFMKEDGKLSENNYSFGFVDRSGISRSIFVSKKDLKRLKDKLKEIIG